jgi:predicted glutamine amidotransferase
MCIAILNKKSTLTIDTIKNSFDNNRDGGSITYIENGKIEVYKELSFNNVNSFYSKYVDIRKNTEFPIMLHFRIGTSGGKNEKNLHPFFVNQNLALVHNGIFDIPEINSEYSDTWHFAMFLRKFKKHDRILKNGTIENSVINNMIDTSKVIFLQNNGSFHIMNEKLGHWDNDTWYSNYTYESCDYYNIGGREVRKNSDYSYMDYYDFPKKVISNGNFGLLSYIDKCKKVVSTCYGYSDLFLTDKHYIDEADYIRIETNSATLSEAYYKLLEGQTI